jgi:hypothetical protein
MERNRGSFDQQFGGIGEREYRTVNMLGHEPTTREYTLGNV